MRLSLSSTPEADGAGDAPQGGTPPPHQVNPDAAAMPPSIEIGESAPTTAPGPQHPTNPTAASSRPASTTPAASSASAPPSSSAAAPSAPAPTTLATGQTGTPMLDDTLSEATMVMIKEAAKNFVKEFGPKLCGKKKELKLPRFDASELFAYFAKVAFNQAYGTHDVTDFPDELLSSGEDTTLPSVPSFDFMSRSSTAQNAESMSFSELERGYEEWQLALHAALSSTLRSDHPEEVGSCSAETTPSTAAENQGSAPVPPAPSPKSTTSTEKVNVAEPAREASESDHVGDETTKDGSNELPSNESKSPQPTSMPMSADATAPLSSSLMESEDSTQNICHVNLEAFLRTQPRPETEGGIVESPSEASCQANQISRQVEETEENVRARRSSSEASSKKKSPQPTSMPMPVDTTTSSSSSVMEANDSTQNICHANLERFLQTQPRPSTESRVEALPDEASSVSNQMPRQVEEADDSTQNICHVNLDRFLQTQPRPSTKSRVVVLPNDASSVSNQMPRQIEEAEQAIQPQPKQQDSAKSSPKESSSKPSSKPVPVDASDANESEDDLCIMNLNLHRQNQASTQNDSNAGESSRQPSSSMNPNNSQQTPKNDQSSSAQKTRSMKRKTSDEDDTSEPKSAKTEPTEPFDFIQEAAMEPFRRTLSPVNADSNGSNEHFSIPEGFYMELDDFEEYWNSVSTPASQPPVPPNSPASTSNENSASSSADSDGNGEVEQMEVDESVEPDGQQKKASEAGPSKDPTDAKNDTKKDSGTDSNAGNDKSSVEESDVRMCEDSDDEGKKKEASKPANPPPNAPASTPSSRESEPNEMEVGEETDSNVGQNCDDSQADATEGPVDELNDSKSDGNDVSEAAESANAGSSKASEAASNTSGDKSSKAVKESDGTSSATSEDEDEKKRAPKPPNSPASSSSSSDSSSSDSDGHGEAEIADEIEVDDAGTEDGQMPEESEAGSSDVSIIVLDDTDDDDIEVLEVDASMNEVIEISNGIMNIEIDEDSDVEIIEQDGHEVQIVELSDDEASNGSEDEVQEVVGAGTDANDQIEPSPSQAQVNSPPKNIQQSTKARTVSRLRQVFEIQQAKKKALEDAKARIKKRQRKLMEERRAKLKARRAKQYNKGPTKSRLRQLYEDGLKKAQLAQQLPEAPTSAPEAEPASTPPPANNEESAIDGSHDAAEINEETSGDTSEAPAPSLPANSIEHPTEAPEDDSRPLGWVRPQRRGSSDEDSPNEEPPHLLMLRRGFFMRQQDRRARRALKLKKKAQKSPMTSPKMRESLERLANSLQEAMRRRLEEARRAQQAEDGRQTPVRRASLLRQMLPDPAVSTTSTVTRPATTERRGERLFQPRSLYFGAPYSSSESSSDLDSNEDADEAVPIQPPSRTPSPQPGSSRQPTEDTVTCHGEPEETVAEEQPTEETDGSTPQPVLRCQWPRCTSCRGKPEEQPTEETDGEVHGREDGDGNAGPNHIEPMDDADLEDGPILDQPAPSPGSSQPPVHPDDDQMEVDPPSRPPTPRPLTPISPGSNPDGHMCGSHCRCPRLYGPQKNRRPARPAPYRPPRRNQEGRAPRQRQTDPQFGRLRHVRNLAGANLPDAPPVVVNQRRVITGSRLEEAMQMQVVNGDNYQAALYHPGVVVFRGHFNGGSRAAALIRQAEEQPVTLFHQPNDPAISIAGGPNHLMILTRSGHVHTIGRPTEGQLGVGDPTRHRQSSVTPQGMLRRVFENNGRDEVIFRRIRTEGNVSVAITLTGRKFKCGEGYGTVFQETDDPMDTDDDEGDDE